MSAAGWPKTSLLAMRSKWDCEAICLFPLNLICFAESESKEDSFAILELCPLGESRMLALFVCRSARCRRSPSLMQEIMLSSSSRLAMQCAAAACGPARDLSRHRMV